MAYSTLLPPCLMGGGRLESDAPNLWTYKTTDSNATVIAAGYVTNAQALGMKVGDLFINLVTGTPEIYMNIVTAVSSTGSTMGSSPATAS